jgi:histidinol dehydrogenase
VLEYTAASTAWRPLDGRAGTHAGAAEAALEDLEPKRRAALEAAARRVRAYHERRRSNAAA